ncbi:hypothetical protein OKW49_007935 [Paraburkholderia youngii]|uniref:hypothetical protein n=1 Tax=Paraburkholderia youngii TaxID=2782701 RepID=UPI003D21678E
MPKGKSRDVAFMHARQAYVLELARGRSYISSTLTARTEERAICETLAEFRETYGEAELAVFQKLLAEELRRHDRNEAAEAVARFSYFCPWSAR